MDSLFLLWFGVLVRLFRGRGKLVLENLALRQQLNVLSTSKATARFVLLLPSEEGLGLRSMLVDFAWLSSASLKCAQP
jgi:hypothetical protein